MPWSLEDTPIKAVLPHRDRELDTQSILPQVQHHNDCNCSSTKLWPDLIFQNGSVEIISKHDEPESTVDTGDVNVYDDDEVEDRNDEGVNNETGIYSRVMKIKGSTWQEIFQQNLHFIRKLLQKSNSCVSLSFQVFKSRGL